MRIKTWLSKIWNFLQIEKNKNFWTPNSQVGGSHKTWIKIFFFQVTEQLWMIFVRRSGKPVIEDKIEDRGSVRSTNGNDWESVGELSIVDC